MDEYTLIETPPPVADYRRLRAETGMYPKTEEAATLGLRGTWYGVHIRIADEIVAMGRIIGDGGCFFQITDIAVLPPYQGRGLGTRIMTALVRHLEAVAPPSALVSLFADGEAWRLYQKFGFEPSSPHSLGMWRVM